MSQVYVKVFVKLNNGDSVFFKDGFTDVRGKFEYARASGDSTMKTSTFRKFAIFVSHNSLGSLIRNVDASKLHSEAQIVKKQ